MADSVWANNSESINTLVSITENDTVEARAVFVKALNSNNGDVERVMDEYWTASSFETFASKYTYDSSVWEADRDGGLPDLVVQGPDEHAPWNHTNGTVPSAPSRPPSRNKSPLAKVTDWTINNTLGVSAPANRADEDEDFRKALALSLGSTTPQESGITAIPESLQQQSPVFGPATRDDHKVDEWALIRSEPVPMDPPPSKRKREAGEPVFLRCRATTEPGTFHRMGALIMLLHEIPAARNFFLLLNNRSDYYGNSPGWWRGDYIITLQDDVDLPDELKRLVAFLDNSDRSYGTADSIFNNSLWNDDPAHDRTAKFFEILYNCTHGKQLSRMWTSVQVKTDGIVEGEQQFAILDLKVHATEPERFHDLYSQWDRQFWFKSDQIGVNNSTTFAYIQEPAQVMTLRVTTEGIAIEIPEVLYLDRYLEKNAKIASKMRDQMSRFASLLARCEKKAQRLNTVKTKTGKTSDRTKVIKRLIRRSEENVSLVRARALWREHEKREGKKNQFPYVPEHLTNLLAEVQLNDAEQDEVKGLQVEIREAKLKLSEIQALNSQLSAQKKEYVAALRRLNQTFTVPSEDESLNPTHKYTLRGVVTTHNQVFICRRKEPEPFVQIDEDANLDKWNMVTWDGNTHQVRHQPTTFDIVKKKIFSEVNHTGKTAPILVYATDQALSETPMSLSDALQTFVKHDNRLFKQELLEEPDAAPEPASEQREKKRDGFRLPQSPAKRQRSDSGDSMDSNRASLGDMSDGDRAQMMQDQMEENFGGSNDTEMMDMQTISAAQMNEIAAHMPPTPSLSADGSVSPPIRRSTEQLANMSLLDSDVEKVPEMEQLQAPFIRRPASAQGSQLVQAADGGMSWPVIDETAVISVDKSPEDFYQRPA